MIRKQRTLFPKAIVRMIESNHFSSRKVNSAELTKRINTSRTAERLGVNYTMPQIRTACANLTRGSVLRGA